MGVFRIRWNRCRGPGSGFTVFGVLEMVLVGDSAHHTSTMKAQFTRPLRKRYIFATTLSCWARLLMPGQQAT
jgi:hypothetical protein